MKEIKSDFNFKSMFNKTTKLVQNLLNDVSNQQSWIFLFSIFYYYNFRYFYLESTNYISNKINVQNEKEIDVVYKDDSFFYGYLDLFNQKGFEFSLNKFFNDIDI
jgi:hypothetical protein